MTCCLQGNVYVAGAGRAIRVIQVGVGTHTVQVTAQWYETWFQLAASLVAQLNAAFGAWTLAPDSSGHPVFTCTANFQLDTNDALWTMPPEMLGLANAAVYPAGLTLTAPHVHRYGWYPQTVPMQAITQLVTHTAVTYYPETGGRAGTNWSSGRPTVDLYFDLLPLPLMRLDGMTEAADHGLDPDDPWCTWERWCLDLAILPSERHWYYYPDLTLPARHGPFIFAPQSPLWGQPLGTSSVRYPAGEIRDLSVDGVGVT